MNLVTYEARLQSDRIEIEEIMAEIDLMRDTLMTDSYTHLTLPTKA